MNRDRNSVRISLIAGSCSGVLSTMVLYPMDVVRTKMQTGGGVAGGPIQVVRHTILHGGIQALYTGMALPLAAQAVYKGTVFSVNNVTQNLILDYRACGFRPRGTKAPSSSFGLAQLTFADRFWCGFAGGAVNGALFVTPVELVRNQLIAQHSKLAANTADSAATIGTQSGTYFRGSWDFIRHTFRKRSALSLWRGIGWTVARDGVGCGCFFYSLARTQQLLTPVGDSPSFPVKVLSGGVAGLAFWVVALPMDSIKTWVQSSDAEMAIVSVKETILKIYSESGPFGVVQSLLRGWQVAYGRGIPSAALTIVVYSFVYDGLYTTKVG
jgi:solute carrier family 25 (mitochondrial carnitine/acylcarnitine transporter), member 20/29